MKFLLPLWTVLLTVTSVYAQTDKYILDASNPVISATKSLPFQGTNPAGQTLSVNNRYFEKAGKPWFPVMGELHYNRVPQAEWADEIQKMKDGGLSIVATYIFWNEHERTQNVWDWTGNRDLRRFVETCREKGMYVWLRIGPWSHGEQLHGGFPEWIQQMKGRRRNTPEYLAASQRLYHQIGEQVQGLFYKEGGPVIGIQLENEYASGDLTHISELKKMAQAANMQPVYWSVTANTVFDDSKTEVIPLQGSYAYRGWESGGGKATKDFLYANDQWIMTDAFGKLYYDVDKYPKGLCEQGCGSQQTFRNRFVVEPHVVEAHLQNQVGRGMNLIGYYMFHGGTQTPGLEEPGYPLSYDFQSPVTEFGLLRPSYKYLKILHHFINDFGSEVAAMQVVKPGNMVLDELNTKNLRYVARIKDNSGFLFLCNTQVRVPMPDKEVALEVKLPDETISFPPMLIKGQSAPVLPFNLKAQGVTIQYATAQPMARITEGNHTTIFFVRLPGVTPVFALRKEGVSHIKAKGWKADKNTNGVVYSTSGKEPVEITDASGGRVTLVFLTRSQAENSWRTVVGGREALILTASDLTRNGNGMELRQAGNNLFMGWVYPADVQGFNNIKFKKDGIYNHFSQSVPVVRAPAVMPFGKAREVTVPVPAHLPASLHDWIVTVRYQGGAAAITREGKLVADDLYNGAGPWRIPVRRFTGSNTALTVTAQPWQDVITGVPEEQVSKIKAEGHHIQEVNLVPQYKLVIE